jgi:iron complex outermembrane receptor protein
MKKIYILFLSLFLAHSLSQAQSKSGIIKGTILSEDSSPLAGINISLQGTLLGAATDINGNFVIRNIPPGTYTLLATGIGYSAKKENVTVQAGKTTELSYKLKEHTNELEEVAILAMRFRSYSDSVTTIGSRSEIKLIDLPQSAQVVTRQILKDQQVFNLNNALPNFAGVNLGDAHSMITMRGFLGGEYVYYNGMRGSPYEYNQIPLLYNIESIEALKGPASALFANGEPGGVINMVTKKPQEKAGYSVDFSYGSWNDINTSFDATGPLTKNKKLLYRFITGYHNGNSFRDFVKYDEVVVTPSLAYVFSDKTRLQVEYMFQNSSNAVNQDEGTYVFTDGSGNINDIKDVDIAFNFANPKDKGRNTSHLLGLNFKHQFNGQLSVESFYRYGASTSNIAVTSGYIGYFSDDLDSLYDRVWWKQHLERTNQHLASWLTYKSSKGKVRNSLQAGFDWIHQTTPDVSYDEGLANNIALHHHDYSKDEANKQPSWFLAHVKYFNTNIAGYVQDWLEISSTLKILGSLRYEHYNSINSPYPDNYSPDSDTTETHAFLPRLGIVYSPKTGTSFYGSYSTSYNPQGSNDKQAGGPFDPELGVQYEIGVKKAMAANKLLATLCVYQIDKQNILVSDPTDPMGIRKTLIDGVRSKGIEATMQGNITTDFSVILNYAYNDIRITKTSSVGEKGDWFSNAPHHISSTWLQYRFTQSRLTGLSLGAGVQYQSNSIGQQGYANSGWGPDIIVQLPQFFIVNTALSYQYKKVTVGVNLNNITNQKYFISAYGITGVAPGSPFNFRTNVSVNF